MSVWARSYASATSLSADGCEAIEGGAKRSVRTAEGGAAPFGGAVGGAVGGEKCMSKSGVLSMITAGAMASEVSRCVSAGIQSLSNHSPKV